MDLQSKLLDQNRSVLLYGTTAPSAGASVERCQIAAARLVDRLATLPIDGLMVYDLQDEGSRTTLPRPYSFRPTIDSSSYAGTLHALTGKPAVAYKSISGMTEPMWAAWLATARHTYGITYIAPVGLPRTPAQQHTLPLSRAIQIAATQQQGFVLGGVTIAERHTPERSESERLLEKARLGCRFFVSQAIYRPELTIRMLKDYQHTSVMRACAPRPIILTFAACGRQKTMQLIKWLGIAIAPEIEHAILADRTPLTRSIQICCDNMRAILNQDYADTLPLGINVESLSNTREELDASVELSHALHDVLATHQRSIARA